MSKKWYPVIVYTKCVECGSCVDMCNHGVYDKLKAPSPIVIFPEGCVQGCKGCGNLCPEKAIQYVGDTVTAGDCGCNVPKKCCG